MSPRRPRQSDDPDVRRRDRQAQQDVLAEFVWRGHQLRAAEAELAALKAKHDALLTHLDAIGGKATIATTKKQTP